MAPSRQGLLEQRNGLGVGPGAHRGPVDGQRGELADLFVGLVADLAGLPEILPRVDRVAVRGLRRPGRPAVGAGRDRLLVQVEVHDVEGRRGHGATVAQGDEVDAVAVDRGHDLEGDLRPALQSVEILRTSGEGLGIVAEQEGRLTRPCQDTVLAGPEDRHAPGLRDPADQPVTGLPDLQRPELSGRDLHPELRVRDPGDEFRIAGVGLLAEEDLGRAAALGRRADAEEEEMGPGFGAGHCPGQHAQE